MAVSGLINQLQLIFTQNWCVDGDFENIPFVCVDGFVLKDSFGNKIPWSSYEVSVTDSGSYSGVSHGFPFKSSDDPGVKIRNDVITQLKNNLRLN